MKKIIFIFMLSIFANNFVNGAEKSAVVIFPNGKYFKLEVADTPEKMAKGLMFRKSLPEDKGMLFIYPFPQPSSYWMKNCLIHIDIIWLSEKGRILQMLENVPPCYGDDCKTYNYNGNAKYVIELHHHTISKFKLKVGNRLDISITNY